MKKIFAFAALLLASVYALGAAETIQRTEQFSSFSGISVPDAFKVTLQTAEFPSVNLNVDARVADYCRAYVQGSVVVIEVDTKSYPKELKKQLKAKGAEPLVLEAVVNVPSGNFNKVAIKGNTILSCATPIQVTQKIDIEVDDNAVIRTMELTGSQVEIKATKKAKLEDVTIKASSVSIDCNNNSVLNLKIFGTNTEIEAKGSSQLTLNNTRLDKIDLKASGSSQIVVNGTANKMSLICKGGANIDAHTASIISADVEMTNCDCSINATENLKLKLASGAKLIFAGNPVINIDEIKNSSVMREADVKAKK